MGIKFEGRVLKDGKYWFVYVPALEAYTQGKSKKEKGDVSQRIF